MSRRLQRSWRSGTRFSVKSESGLVRIRQLLIESNLDPNNPDNYRVARELLFNQRSDGVDAGLDIKVNITGGGIKKCRPVSLFKSAVATEDKITVKINWFFVASSFVDFRTISGSGRAS